MNPLQGWERDAASADAGRATPSVALQAAHALARQAWPSVQLSYEQFHAHVSRAGSTPLVVPAHPTDVYLCAACNAGQVAAYRALEAAYFPALRALLERLLRDHFATEEVLQEVRTRLFVGEAPKIASYLGTGCLAGWLRSVAVHAAQDQLRAAQTRRRWLQHFARAQRSTSGAQPRAAAATTDDQAFHTQRARLCEQAWNSAIRSLGSSERQLLFHHFVSGLSIDVLSALHAVHRATVARRIRRAAALVRRRVREALAAEYRDWSARDLDALALGSCRDVDVTRALEPPYAA